MRVFVLLALGACGFSNTAKGNMADDTVDAPAEIDASIDTPAPACPSTIAACPMGYVRVNNCAFGTTEFCVMKYEAKQSGTMAISVANGKPWGTITTAAAKAACAANGAGYHLITNAEWMATARLIEATPDNWSTTATPFLSKGKTDDCGLCTGAATDPAFCPSAAGPDNNPCVGVNVTGCTDRGNSAFRYNRTAKLGTNGVIWDLSGNMFELIDHPLTRNATQGSGAGQHINGTTGSSFDPPLAEIDYKSSNTSHTDVPTTSMMPQQAVQNVGILYVTDPTNAPNVTRGGDFCGFAGIYSIALLRDVELGVNIGFRCVFK